MNFTTILSVMQKIDGVSQLKYVQTAGHIN